MALEKTQRRGRLAQTVDEMIHGTHVQKQGTLGAEPQEHTTRRSPVFLLYLTCELLNPAFTGGE